MRHELLADPGLLRAGGGRRQHEGDHYRKAQRQNVTFAASWSWRASNVWVIVPKAAWLRLPFGARKFTRLSRLNASTRNWTRVSEPTGSGNSFAATASSCQNHGPRAALRGAFPNGLLGSVGAVTLSRLRYSVTESRLPYGLPFRFAR